MAKEVETGKLHRVNVDLKTDGTLHLITELLVCVFGECVCRGST